MGKFVKRVKRRVYQAILESLQDDAPDLYEELRDLRHNNPQQYRKEIRLLVANGYAGGSFDEYAPLFVREGERDEYRVARNAAQEQLYSQMQDAVDKPVAKKKPASKKKSTAKKKKAPKPS